MTLRTECYTILQKSYIAVLDYMRQINKLLFACSLFEKQQSVTL